jgi:hypothetical protein
MSMNINWQEPIDAAEQVVAAELGERVSYVSVSIMRRAAELNRYAVTFMTWRHYLCELLDKPASVLIDDRFVDQLPLNELPRLSWFGVYCNEPTEGRSGIPTRRFHLTD